MTNGIPLKDNSVDLIYSSHLLEHIAFKELILFLKECKRILKNNGVFSVCVPNAGYYLNAYFKGETFENNYYPPALIETGSKIDQINYTCKYIALKRCIINLLNNAKAYGDEAVIKLSENDKEILINIEDNGPGINEKDYEKALKPFQRLDSSRNQNIAGSGLGLSISQDIIKTIGGNINLSKSSLGGLKVSVLLPKKY